MFMLQQAAETTFRSTAMALYGSERRTHSIRSLKRFNHRLAPQLNDIFPGGHQDEERLLQLLEDAYLGGRYNPDYQINEQEVHAISSRVLRMLELAESVFEGRMAAMPRRPTQLLLALQQHDFVDAVPAQLERRCNACRAPAHDDHVIGLVCAGGLLLGGSGRRRAQARNGSRGSGPS